MAAAQAVLVEWEGVIKLLVDAKAHAAGGTLLESWDAALAASLSNLSMELAFPAATWKQLLQNKVPHRVLVACRELMAAPATSLSAAAATVAAVLLQRAAADLPPLAASSSNRGSSRGASARGSSDRSRLSAVLWQQLEQSGLLQQLPGMFSRHSSTLRAAQRHTTADQCSMSSDGKLLSRQTTNLCKLLDSLQQIQPCFLTAHTAGQQCVVPAMELSLCSLQYISRALAAVAGRQEWMEGWLAAALTAVHAAASAASSLFEGLLSQQGRAAAGSRSSSSSSASAGVAVVQAEQTTQVCCLGVVLPMLAQLLSDSSSGGSVSQWLPAALAPSMPAAYSCMLEQLGCSREVGLWLAQLLSGSSSSSSGCEDDGVFEGMLQFVMLMQAAQRHNIVLPQLAALYLSVAAVSLQWVSGLPLGRLLALKSPQGTPGGGWSGIWQLAAAAYVDGEAMMQVQGILQTEGAGGAGQYTRTRKTLEQTSAAVLAKLLGMCRSAADSAPGALPGQGASSSSRADSRSGSRSGRSSRSGSSSTTYQFRQHVLTEVSGALVRAARLAQGSARTSSGKLPAHLPLQHGQCCSLLEDCVRLVAAAAAAEPNPGNMQQLVTLLESLPELLHDAEADNATPSSAIRGPLLAPVAGAGAAVDVSSPEALQLFGLLCSLSKAENVMPLSHRLIACRGSGLEQWQQWSVSEALLAAVCAMVQAALGAGSSSVCAAVLPWLTLLGRCSHAWAMLLQQWHDSLSDELSGSSPLQQLKTAMMSHGGEITKVMQQLQASLAAVAEWLAAAGTVEVLSPLGYGPQVVQQQQQQLAAAADTLLSLDTDRLGAVSMLVSPDGGAEVLQTAQQQLHAAGRVLGCFAIRHACNNAACGNMDGPSEAVLVGRRSNVCSGCRSARYCGPACQRVAWRHHKPVCRALAAAAAATAAAAPAAADAATAAAAAADAAEGGCSREAN